MPNWNDSKRDLLLGISNAFYNLALARGAIGLTPVNFNDSPTDLIRKWAYFSAVALALQP